MQIVATLRNRWKRVLVGGFFLIVAGCTAIITWVYYSRSTDHFLPLSSETRILYEPVAETFAADVGLRLPDAIKTVEAGHGVQFQDPIKVYVCASPESFKKVTGRTVRALMYRKSVFLSPKLMELPDMLEPYLTHELSHLLLMQHVGGYKYIKIPAWFHEGLATFVSGGGGAHEISAAEAQEAIRVGSHFLPLETAGIKDLFVPKYASYWGLTHHTFYRQCMLFVAYFKEKDKKNYLQFLHKLHEGENFAESFQQAFGTKIAEVWEQFKNDMNEK